MDFFEIANEGIPSKCKSCKLNKKEAKKRVEKKVLNTHVIRPDSDVLIILEKPVDVLVYATLNKLFKKYDLKFDLVNGIECVLKKDADYPSPIHSIYTSCNTVKSLDFSKYKVIITEGRSTYAVTESSDLRYYHDFTEITFNQTYFYKHLKHLDRLIRVYPLPAINEFMTLSSNTLTMLDVWERFYVNTQLERVSLFIASYKEEKLEPFNIIKVEDPNEFLKQHLNYNGYLAWDLEIASNNSIISLQMFSEYSIICITMSFDGKTGYYLPFDKINKRVLRQFLLNKKSILANGKYDTKCLHNAGISDIIIEDDVILMNKVLNTTRMSNSIKSLAWLIGFGGYDSELDAYTDKYKIKNYGDIPENILIPYATIDSIVTYRLWEYAIENAKIQPEPFNAYRKYIVPALEVFKSAEIEGVPIDIEYLKSFNHQLAFEIEEVSKKIYDYIGYSFNISSLDELGDALKKKGLPPISLNKKKIYKTGEPELLQWKKQGFEEISDLISSFRELSTLRKTFVGNTGNAIDTSKNESEEIEDNSFFVLDYELVQEEKIDGIVKFIASDNKIHPSFGVAMTDSGRASCNNPNFQNQPKQGKYAKRFRKIYNCPTDWYYGGFDYSGFQLRIAAIYSKDENMLDAFINRGGDLHSATAQIVFARNMTLDEFIANKNKQPYKKWRFEAKSVNFLFLFSGSYSLMYDNIDAWGMTDVEEYIEKNNLTVLSLHNRTDKDKKILTVCKDIQDRFFLLYPRLKEWFENSHTFARANGYIDSPLGGRRHLPRLLKEFTQDNGGKLKNQFNISLNSPVQNFEAFTVYEAMAKIHEDLNRYKMKSKLIGSVHDEITHFIYKPEVKDVYEIAKKHMFISTEVYGCPITAELGIGYIWGFDTEATDKNIDKFLKGNFIKITYEDEKNTLQEYENIAYDIDDIKEEFLKKFPSVEIKKIDIIH